MSLPIAARLTVDKCRATVRYVGSVEGQQGTWVGLEWDDPARGKHDGTVGNRRYFSCRDAACSGSFVREAKLLQVADLGTTVSEAILKRFAMHRIWQLNLQMFSLASVSLERTLQYVQIILGIKM